MCSSACTSHAHNFDAYAMFSSREDSTEDGGGCEVGCVGWKEVYIDIFNACPVPEAEIQRRDDDFSRLGANGRKLLLRNVIHPIVQPRIGK
ncbi:hypothetical protein OIDMADRAFT_19621 [Oidiodendron maius Zn]|uniref:Uncharacterized protein n=1 Tax=Oidiodendron maius (strain Zn) TaxID=913774 RepID=A0A0C3GTR2_OIDMZ|nr:hypothetical protein OIDMADRAFT_19621 [Oidiodendron maius Zn]